MIHADSELTISLECEQCDECETMTVYMQGYTIKEVEDTINRRITEIGWDHERHLCPKCAKLN